MFNSTPARVGGAARVVAGMIAISGCGSGSGAGGAGGGSMGPVPGGDRGGAPAGPIASRDGGNPPGGGSGGGQGGSSGGGPGAGQGGSSGGRGGSGGGSPDGAASLDAGNGSTGAAAMPSPGCSGATAVVGQRRRTTSIDGRERSYLVVVPPAGGPSRPLPLVFAWHGLGGSGTLARQYFGIEAASAGKAVFVYPDALPLPAFANRTGWDLTAEGPDVRFFRAMLADLSGNDCIDLQRVFSAGHSFGGYMTNALGCHADGLRAIAPVAGGLPPGSPCAGKPLAAWLAHGMNDGTVPFAQGEAARARWAQASACASTTGPTPPPPCVAYDGCQPDAPVVWCVHNLNHAWPPFAGPAIWQFFARF